MCYGTHDLCTSKILATALLGFSTLLYSESLVVHLCATFKCIHTTPKEMMHVHIEVRWPTSCCSHTEMRHSEKSSSLKIAEQHGGKSALQHHFTWNQTYEKQLYSNNFKLHFSPSVCTASLCGRFLWCLLAYNSTRELKHCSWVVNFLYC